MKITLKPHEKLFINGAVMCSDKKVTLELINDAVFLLESHVLHEDATDTPLKQLYFAAQLMLIDPNSKENAMPVFVQMLRTMLCTYSDGEILSSLKDCAKLAEQDKIFDILKLLRGLFDRESKIISGNKIS